jgi:hypothetical protein
VFLSYTHSKFYRAFKKSHTIPLTNMRFFLFSWRLLWGIVLSSMWCRTQGEAKHSVETLVLMYLTKVVWKS